MKLSPSFKPEAPEPEPDDDDITSLAPSWWHGVIPSIVASHPPSWFVPRLTNGLVFSVGGVAIDQEKLAKLKEATPYKVTHRVPDYVSVITAWRAWKAVYQDGAWILKAIGVEHVWKPKEAVHAQCQIGLAHPAPTASCTCGVWAFKELDSLVAALGSAYNGINVIGQVSLWGRVIETENGYRAEKAYPS